jgi:hypothetical protein
MSSDSEGRPTQFPRDAYIRVRGPGKTLTFAQAAAALVAAGVDARDVQPAEVVPIVSRPRMTDSSEHVLGAAAVGCGQRPRRWPPREGCECTGEAEIGDPADEAIGLELGRGAIGVIGAEVEIEGAIA